MRPPARSRNLLPMVMATALALMVLDVAGFTPISELRRTVVSVGAPIGRLLAFAVSPVTDTWHGAVHYDDLQEENRELRRRNAELAGTLAGQPDARAELETLLQAADITFLGDVERVTARVVADRRSNLERVLEIDKGRSAGIAEGMPVATGAGLVGVVQVAAIDRSVIRLLTDVEVAVGVRSTHGLGIVVGDGPGPLRFEASPELIEAIRFGKVSTGERFVTSGVDRSVYPAGIPVGTLVLTFDDGRQRIDPPRLAGPTLSIPAAPAGDPRTILEADDDSALLVAAIDGYRGDFEAHLEPLATLDRLGYVSVLLIEQAP